MKTTLAALFATALFAAPAMACGFKSADTKHDTRTAIATPAPVTTDKAMSTYDPVEKPLFEQADATAPKPLDLDDE